MGAEQPVRDSGRIAWYWRLAIWIVAVPFGFIVTTLPAWQLGLIRKSDVLDIFVRSGIGRFERLALSIIIWSLITASAVQLLATIIGHQRSTHSEPRHAAPADEDILCATDIKPQL
jgi:hypothetical protein